MDLAETQHLLRRAGHGTRPHELAEYQALSRVEAVDRLLDWGLNPAVSLPGELADGRNVKPWKASGIMQRWWMERWRTVPRPLEEKLLLAMHDHLVVDSRTADHALSSWDHLFTLRSLLGGTWPAMIQRIALDPLMLYYLDNHKNRSGHANENFARELLELHVLGIGQYSENDVRELARAWTGYGLDPADDRIHRFDSSRHDHGDKTIFGITRAWKGPEVVDHIFTDSRLRQVAARHLVRRLFGFFVHEKPTDSQIERLANSLIGQGWSIKGLVRSLLLDPAADSLEAREGKVRTPAEMLADLMRCSGLTADLARPEWSLGRMGMDLFRPPNPAGYGGNEAYVNPAEFMGRADCFRRMAWKATNAGFLGGTAVLTPAQAVTHAAQQLGVVLGSTSHSAVEQMVIELREREPWAEPVSLFTAVSLTPEFAL